ncbi:MAG: tetratricopeptide repeat protein [Thermodesulfobacteriota bacterium]
MDAVTYPDKAVIGFISNHIIPLRVPYDHQPLAQEFKVHWTPTLVSLDLDGKEHHRTLGFLPPEELIPSLMLGIGKTYFDLGQFAEAIEILDKVVTEHARSDSAPQAIYFRGVAQYKHTHDPKKLRLAYDRLAADFPNDEWAKRARPYSLIT